MEEKLMGIVLCSPLAVDSIIGVGMVTTTLYKAPLTNKNFDWLLKTEQAFVISVTAIVKRGSWHRSGGMIVEANINNEIHHLPCL